MLTKQTVVQKCLSFYMGNVCLFFLIYSFFFFWHILVKVMTLESLLLCLIDLATMILRA